MGGRSSTQQQQQQQSSQTNTIDPDQKAMLMANYTSAQNRANSLTPYTGQLTAGFTPTQTQAQGLLTSAATDPTYAANNQAAINGVQGILSSNPTASTIANSNLSQYENPYTSDVINASVTANERARQIANVNDNQTATAAGAFGGSRSGVANALTNQLYDQNDQSNIANLNSANFTQAQNAAAADAATKNAFTQQNVTNKLNAAGQLSNLNNAALNTAATQGGLLGAVGDAQQNQNQTALTNAYNAYMAGQNLTLQQQNLLNSALGLIPVQQTITGSSTGSSNGTTTTNPGLGGILGGVASIGLGIGSMGTSTIGGKLLGF